MSVWIAFRNVLALMIFDVTTTNSPKGNHIKQNILMAELEFLEMFMCIEYKYVFCSYFRHPVVQENVRQIFQRKYIHQ